MKKQILTLTIGLSIITFGLNAQGHDHNNDHKEHGEMNMSYDAPANFQEQLRQVYVLALELNKAFVASDTEEVIVNVKHVKEALATINMKLITGDAHMVWMGHHKELNTNLDAMLVEGSIANQRNTFALFNGVLFKSIKAFGIQKHKVYYQYCPMANGNKGAYWLSASETIQNPYFGKMMLNCGSTKEVLN